MDPMELVPISKAEMMMHRFGSLIGVLNFFLLLPALPFIGLYWLVANWGSLLKTGEPVPSYEPSYQPGEYTSSD